MVEQSAIKMSNLVRSERYQDLRASIFILSEHAKLHGKDVSRMTQERISEIYGQYLAVRRQRSADRDVVALIPRDVSLSCTYCPFRKNTREIHSATNSAISPAQHYPIRCTR